MLQPLQLKLHLMLHIDPISGKRRDITKRNEQRQTHIAHIAVCDCRSDTDTTKSHQSTEAEEYRHSQATPGGQSERENLLS